MFGGYVRIVLPQCLHRRRVPVGTKYPEALPDKPVQVAAGAGAGIQNGVRRSITVFQNLVEQVNIGIAEEVGEWVHRVQIEPPK